MLLKEWLSFGLTFSLLTVAPPHIPPGVVSGTLTSIFTEEASESKCLALQCKGWPAGGKDLGLYPALL